MSSLPEIIGRSTELEAISVFLDPTTEASGLLLRGDAGMGKTILWRHLVAAARAGSSTVLTAQPAESETRSSFAVLGDLVAGLPDDALDMLPGPQRTALDVALLRAVGLPADPLAVSMAFSTLITSISRVTPVVIAIDDAQWIDAPSARVLGSALRRAVDRGVRFALAVRAGEAAPLADALQRVAAVPPVILDLAPLSLAALHHLFASRLDRHFPRPTLVRLANGSRGNPLVALEIARALVEFRGVQPGHDRRRHGGAGAGRHRHLRQHLVGRADGRAAKRRLAAASARLADAWPGRPVMGWGGVQRAGA